MLVIPPIADAEIDEAIAYLNSQKTGLGLEFLDELYDLLRLIEINPRCCPWHDDRFRRGHLKRFKFNVIYEPEPDPIVIAIYHHARDEKYWRGRVQ